MIPSYPRKHSTDFFESTSEAKSIADATRLQITKAIQRAENRGFAKGFKAALEAARDASCKQCELGISLNRRWPNAMNVHEKSSRYHGLRNCACPDGILELLEELTGPEAKDIAHAAY